MTQFSELGLSAGTLRTLEELNFTAPTPIQAQAIPMVLARHDLIGLAQTGTGKTAAFGLPIIEHLAKDAQRPEPKAVRALILAPTRELVSQIAGNLRSFVKDTRIRIALVVGGASIGRQAQTLARGVDILVATPGRLLDLAKRGDVNLTAVRYLVLDEADQMLDLGFIHDLRKISKLVPKRRQTLLFSATMPKLIEELAQEYLTDPRRVEVTPPGRTADRVEQFVHFVTGKDQKTTILRDSLNANPDGRAMVFLRTKHTAEKLSKHLEHIGFAAVSIHGNKSQGQRERALKAFRDGEAKVLVATDVAARGIDIPDVTHVYNYDLPNVPDAYVHRIGRTARAGREGIAIAFCAPDEVKMLRDIERLTKAEMAVVSGERPEFMSGGKTGGNNNSQPARKQHRKGPRPGSRPPREAQASEGGHHQPGRPDGDNRQRPHKNGAGRNGKRPGGNGHQGGGHQGERQHARPARASHGSK
mgnify:CR=1 FL=1